MMKNKLIGNSFKTSYKFVKEGLLANCQFEIMKQTYFFLTDSHFFDNLFGH